mgnify:CR=1 FL=1
MLANRACHLLRPIKRRNAIIDSNICICYPIKLARNLSGEKKFWFREKLSFDSNSRELVRSPVAEIFQKEFPESYSDGKFSERISYVDFIDQALEKMDDLGLSRNLEAYKELLKVFPPGKYCRKGPWDIGLFHAPQQLAAIRILLKMELKIVPPDEEVQQIVEERFSKYSDVWKKVARMNYWTMKARNIDANPLPEIIPQRPHEIAKLALIRMQVDPKTLINVTTTASLPDAVDRTWIVYSQSQSQKDIIERLDEKTIIYIEETGLSYVKDKFLSYFCLKVYDDERARKERATKRENHNNFNKLKMSFYGKPIAEKLREPEEVHHVGDGYVLAIGITGTSSQDSALSLLKLLQRRNPKLSRLNVVFKMKRPTMELIDPNQEFEQKKERHSDSV